MPGGWPALETLLNRLRAAPSRTGSVISTIYGDAVLPRGGALALTDLLALMRRLGASEGVVRTAVSRLAQDGVLIGRRAGRRSAYALSAQARLEFAAAVPLIYGAPPGSWDGRLRLAFPDPGQDRTALEAAGFVVLSPGVLAGTNDPPRDPPPGAPVVRTEADPATLRLLAARAWPLSPLVKAYGEFIDMAGALAGAAPPTPLDAMAARILLIHVFRRIALRDPRLPTRLCPADWPGPSARTLCRMLYAEWTSASEAWLDQASDGSGPLPPGPDPLLRFSGGDR